MFTFDETPIMSTYLVAWVISKFENVKTNDMRFGIYGRRHMIRGNLGKFALDNVQPTIKYLENYLGIKYVIDKLYQVGIPDEFVNFEATDSWGLIIYKYLYML